MNIQRFYAATTREALAKARMAFGEGTLILANRQTPQGVEVVATTEDALSALDAPVAAAAAPARAAAPAQAAAPARARPTTAPVAMPRVDSQTPVEDDAAVLAMSTLSFQDYVRERMLQRRHEGQQVNATPAAAARPAYEIIPADPPAPASVRKAAAAPAPLPAPKVAAPAAAPAAASQGVVNELHAMKELIEERFGTLAWLGQTQKSPVRANLTLKLIRSGYSPALARAVLSMMPDDASPAEAVHWLMGVLQRNLKTDASGPALQDEGGVFALVGATGIGKTTTAAKLAAQCARTHGAASVGLITLDSYRVGAHEQLRAYGRMLGVVAHMAHDRAALQDLLGLLGNKKLVLIDTTGVAPRDPRKRDMLDMLELPQIKRLLVLNAASHGDTQDEAVASFRANPGSAGAQQTVLTKIDEAVKLGPVLDTVIRHHLVLRGVSTGQRVPEDWERADAAHLVRLSMRSTGKSAHDPQMSDLGLYFAHPAATVGVSSQGRLHA